MRRAARAAALRHVQAGSPRPPRAPETSKATAVRSNRQPPSLPPEGGSYRMRNREPDEPDEPDEPENRRTRRTREPTNRRTENPTNPRPGEPENPRTRRTENPTNREP